MGNNNLSTATDGNTIFASGENQYKTALSGDLYPRASDGTINDAVSNIGATSNQFADLHMSGVPYNKGVKLLPAGMMMPYAGSTAPTDWLLCNGDTIGNAASGATHAGAQYEDLFDVVKATWGNSGTEVFADGDTVLIPDLSDGRFLRNTGGNAAALGVNQADQNDAHTHGQNTTLDNGFGVQSTVTQIRPEASGGITGTPVISSVSSGGKSQVMTDSTGGNESRPINVAVNYLIRI